MSGKFMKIKKILIPTITLCIMASQLCGCSAATSEEMMAMLERQEAIEIEVATPISQEQGTEIQLDWIELAYRDNYREFRDIFDDTLGITMHGDNGKNGVVYVDMEGNHTNNSTLRYAFNNKQFLDKCWTNTDAIKAIVEATQNNYVDVQTDKAAMIASLNAYFNLLADAEPGYANLNSTLTRLETMSFIFKADTPVHDIEPNSDFFEAVGAEVGSDSLAIYAQGLADQSYLDYSNLSLDDKLANSTITRAEYIYMLVQRYYADEYTAVTDKDKCSYNDVKNGKDIAGKVGFVTTDKETGVKTEPNRWQAYELSYSLQNADKGMPDDLYRAMVVAGRHGLITDSESRWDEGLTKGDAINILVNTYKDLGANIDVARGESTGEDLSTDHSSTSNGAHASSKYEKAEEVYCQYESIDPITLYAKVDGAFFGDPNYFDNTLTVQGAYDQGYEQTFDMKTVYEGVEYYAKTTGEGLILIGPAADFTTEAVEIEKESYEAIPATPEQIEESKAAMEEAEQQMKENGFSDQEIDAIYGEGTLVLTPDMYAGDASEIMDQLEAGIGWTDEMLDQVDGLQPYRSGN